MRRWLDGLARTGTGPRTVFAVCAAMAAAAWFWPVDPATSPSVPARAPLDLARLASLDGGEALQRPVFDPQRRGWTAGGSLADVLGQERPSITLILRGVLVDARSKRAFVDDGTPGAGWLSEGDGRESWRIVAIEPGRVVVADGAQRYSLDFLGAPVRLRPAFRLQPDPPPAEGGDLRRAL